MTNWLLGFSMSCVLGILGGNAALWAAPDTSRIMETVDTHKKVYEDSHVYAVLGKSGGDGLILIPGGEVAAKRYVDLAQEIVRQAPEVSVFVARFTRDYVTPWEVGPKVKAILGLMERLGWRQPASSTYLAGHSMGGLFGHSQVESANLRGLILLASYLPQAAVGGAPYTVSSFPKPILILGGEWDRRVDLHVQARAFDDFEAWRRAHPGDLSKVVGVLPGASHMQFADGELLASDVPPTRSTAEIHTETAKLIAAFLRLQGESSGDAADRQIMEDLLSESQKVFSTVTAAQTLDKSACAVVQAKLAPHMPGVADHEPAPYAAYGTFALSRPKVDDRGILRVPTHLEQPPNPFDLPGTPFGIPVALSCKLTLPRPEGSVRLDAASRCAGADRLLAQAVERLLTPDQQERSAAIEARINVSSQTVASWVQWLVTPTTFRNKGDVTRWESRSVEWLEAGSQSDVLHCKLTPPTRWLFYYLRDAHLTSLEKAVRL